MNKDLTCGKPQTVLWQFSLPLLGSVLFQQLYNIADSFVAGKFIGENALAAVGNAYEITLIFIAFAFGSNIGCSVIISRLFGAQKYADLKTAVSTTFISVAALCAALMAGGLLLCRPMLELINTPQELMAGCRLYLNIYLLGLPFLFYYNVSTGIFSAMGDSRTPFLFLAASSTSNILVDILFVKVFAMGIAGVAWATFLCQGVSAVLAMLALRKRLRTIAHAGSPRLFSLPLLKNIVSIALPSTLQQSFVSVGNIIIQSVINGYGPSVIAGYSAAIKLNNLVITSLTQLGNGMSNYTSQNIGANKHERIAPGFSAGIRMVFLVLIPVLLLYVGFPALPVSVFMDGAGGGAMQTGIQFLRIVAPFYLVVCVKLIADGVLRGAGLMSEFMISTFSDLLLRVGLCIVFSSLFGAVGIWCSWPVGWAIGTAMSCLFYHRYRRSLSC
ncbi:MAG: MATE family efflux transporter [Clostridiales bacterium]|nr:MATE family efflux transporter [Clostridiales bacterium]MDY5514571.1 MATE family efflux transporter [Candidatus Ventricola sp.]